MIFRLLLVATVLAWSASAHAARRVALVLGNSDYQHTVKLPNTRNDANAIANMLRQVGFQVISGVDLNRQAMGDRLADFSTAAADADVALFFYAGHAIQVNGRNLMIPVDANIKSEIHAKTQTVDLDDVLGLSMSTAKAKIVLLDACRDNPFEDAIRRSLGPTRSVNMAKGLAEMKPTEGALIAFATSPGQTALDGKGGTNSPFTTALIQNLPTPGVEINTSLTKVRAQVFEQTGRQQLPWTNTSMTGLIYLSDKPAGEAVQTAALTPGAVAIERPAAPTGRQGDDKEGERMIWRSAEELKTADAYQLYLDRYPAGDFADMARLKLAALPTKRSLGDTTSGAVPDGTPETENALNLDRSGWTEVQRKLRDAGHKVSADGKIGEGTRKAIRAWQGAQKYASTGYLNEAQLGKLKATPAVASNDDDDEDDAKPVRRSVSRSASEGGSSRSSSSKSSNDAAGAAIMGTAIGIGLGIAAGRIGRR